MPKHAPKAQFKTAEAAKTFLVPANSWAKQRAYVTLRSKKTGQRFTYRVSAHKNNKNTDSPALTVGALVGSDNTTSYKYFGVIKRDAKSGEVYFTETAGSQLGPNAPARKAFEWSFGALCADKLPGTLEVWHEGRCARCGKILTVPESIETGLGPVCAKNH
jgi:hypothetical protein